MRLTERNSLSGKHSGNLPDTSSDAGKVNRLITVKTLEIISGQHRGNHLFDVCSKDGPVTTEPKGEIR